MPQNNYAFYNKISIGLVLAILAVGYLFTYSQYSGRADIQSRLTTLNQEHAKLQDAQNSLDTFLQYYKSHQQDVITANSALPVKSVDMPNFLNIVSTLAAQSGITLSNFRINEPESAAQGAENGIQTILINVIGTGTFPAFKDLIIRFESSRRLIDVDHVIAQPSISGGNNLQYQINIKTYYQK